MDSLNATFADYQAQYETYLSLGARKALDAMQVRSHYAVLLVDEYFPAPECVIRMTQLAVAILSMFPSIESSLEMPRQFCKDAKNFTNFVKGLKSVDGLLHFQFAWRAIVLNISGFTLFVVSGLSLIERFNFLNTSTIKLYLTAIPLFGTLPWGGLLSLSVVGLLGMGAFLTAEKRSKLQKYENHIKNEKLKLWSQPLDLLEVQGRQNKYQSKVRHLTAEVDAYQALIKEGKQIESDFNQDPNQASQLFACQKALNELASKLKHKEKELKTFETKNNEWSLLEKNWYLISFQELENFRQAKYHKWETKLKKVQIEKRVNFLSFTNSILIVARQALTLVSAASGYGIMNLPAIGNIGLDAYVAGSGMMNFLMKRKAKQVKTLGVVLIQYVSVNKNKKSPILNAAALQKASLAS